MGDRKVRRGQLSYWVSLVDHGEADDPRLHRHSSALETVPYFCTSANLQSAIVYLSQELQGMGLSCPLIETESQRVNLVALVNTCWEVTQLYRASIQNTNTLHDQRRRDVSDLSHCQNSIRDLKGSVEEKERLVCDAQERERQAATYSKTLATKLRAERDEVRRLGSALQQREAHHQHELRKKETENNRLRERVHRLVSGERSSEARASTMAMSSTLTRTTPARAKWRIEATTARHEEDLHQRVLSHYERWIEQLTHENDQLKTCVSTVSLQLSKLVAKCAKKENNHTDDINMSVTSVLSADSLDNVVVNLEFPAFRDQLVTTFEDNIKALGQVLGEKGKSEEGSEVELKEKIEELQKELKEAQRQLHNQDSGVGSGETEEGEPGQRHFRLDGSYVEEMELLEKQKRSLVKERKLLREERQTFSDATIRLNRERAAFEAEKVEMLRRQFLQELPASLNDTGADTAESGGSLSGSSVGDMFESPQRVVAVPNITSPQGTVTFLPGSPLVLGPSLLPKQQQQSGSLKCRGPSRRL